MKYLIPFALLLMLSACEQNSPEIQDHITVAAPEKTLEKNTLSYLDQPLKGKISQRGLYRLVRSNGMVDNPDTTTGKAISKPVIQLVESTERIPLIKSGRMYLQYRMWYFPNQLAYAELRRVLKHPRMTLPDGTITTGSDFMMKRRVSSNQVIGYTGYGFDEDYEMVEGDWIFEIWYKDKKLIEQKFITYWPDETEIAELKPVLTLGNKVLSKMKAPNNPDPRLNWSRVIVGGGHAETPPGASDVQQQFTDPLNK